MSLFSKLADIVWEKHQGKHGEGESRDERAHKLVEAEHALKEAKEGAKVVEKLTGKMDTRDVDMLAPFIQDAFNAALRPVKPKRAGKRRWAG